MSQPTEHLGLYRLIPLAAADDPNWDKAPSHGEVVVRAYSPADARVVAADAEGDFLGRAKPGDGNSTSFASAFRDDKLYTVVDEGGSGDGIRGVVEGDFSFPVVKPDAL